MTLSVAARRRGRYALIALLVTMLTMGNAGLVGPTDRASAASAVTVSAVNALTGAPAASVGVAAMPVSGGAPVVATTGGDGKAQLSLSAGQYVFGPSETPSSCQRGSAAMPACIEAPCGAGQQQNSLLCFTQLRITALEQANAGLVPA